MARLVAFLCALVVCAAAAVYAETAELPARAAIEPLVGSLVTRFLEDTGASAVSIAVVRGEDTLVLGGWGLADRDAGIAATAETSYRIGSISKQFTAAAVMRLVERKQLALDDPIGKYVDELPQPWRGATIRQLLNHTSGIPDFTETGRRWMRRWSEELSPRALVALVARDRMRFAAGSKWEYSNTNYVLLGLLVEKLYVRPLGEVIREEFAEPLGLTHTRSCEDAPGANGQARGYVLKDERLHARPYRHASHGFGAGDLCSTVADLAKWNRALHGGRVVDETSYTLMTTPQGAAMAGNYGFGLLVTSTPGSRVIFHNGGMSGFISRNTWFPEHSMSVVVLVNTSPARQEETLARDLARVALGRPVEIVHPQTTAVDAATLRRYAGRYVIQVPGRPLAVRLWVDRGKLMAQAEGQTAFELRPAGEHTFGAAVDPTMKFTFVVREDVVTGLLFQQGGRTFETVKKD